MVTVGIAFTLVLLGSAWTVLDGEDESWEIYSIEEQEVLGEFGSAEDCQSAMFESEQLSGCIRTDGPFRLLSSIADVVF